MTAILNGKSTSRSLLSNPLSYCQNILKLVKFARVFRVIIRFAGVIFSKFWKMFKFFRVFRTETPFNYWLDPSLTACSVSEFLLINMMKWKRELVS